MGAIKSKIFDDSTTLDHESLKPGEMTKMRQNDENMSLASAKYVTNQPERMQSALIDKVQDINLDEGRKEIINSGMQSASAASFQPPDFMQRSQYFRSFRSASRRFFGKKDHADDSISKISKENETSTGNNIPNRNYFYRSFKNLNRNNLNCISNLKNDNRENIKGEAQPLPEMKHSWFKNLKSRSNADFGLKNSLNTKKSNGIISEEISKFSNNKNLVSKSFNEIPTTLGLSLVEIDTDETNVKKKLEPRQDINTQSSNSSSSSAGIFSRQSNGSINNSRSYDQFNTSVQIPIKILKDQQSFKQKQHANYINSVFLNELNALSDLSKNNDSLIDKLKSEVEILSRLLDVFDRDDPKVINELIFKTDNFTNQAQKLQTEVKEQLKIKNKNNQMNRFTSEVVIKLYEECIIRLDRQLEILVTQINELVSIKQFLLQVASDYNQQSQYSSSSSSYGYSDSYYSSTSSDSYYPNYPNYHPRNNFYYSSRNGYPPHYYGHPNQTYIEQPSAYYFTYRTPQQTNLFYDTVSGQYFYRKPHVHVHPHGHPHPANQYYPNQSGPYQRNSQNFFHSSPAESNSESKPNGGAIITEVSDDEDDYLRNKSEKKKDYVDAISLKEDE